MKACFQSVTIFLIASLLIVSAGPGMLVSALYARQSEPVTLLNGWSSQKLMIPSLHQLPDRPAGDGHRQ